jgi:hypothetical protein
LSFKRQAPLVFPLYFFVSVFSMAPLGSKSLLMPAPVRTGLSWPPSFFDEEAAADCVNTLEEADAEGDIEVLKAVDIQTLPGPTTFDCDPHARDIAKRNREWSAEPLAKYLKGAVAQIEANIETHKLPTDEKLDAFVSRLVENMHKFLKRAPKDLRRTLQAKMSRRFKTFWNFDRNEKVRSTSPEELKSVVTSLIKSLVSNAVVGPVARSPLTKSPLTKSPLPKYH